MGRVGYINGFNSRTAAFILGEDGRYIATPGKRYNQVLLAKIQSLHHNQIRVRFLVKQPLTPARHWLTLVDTRESGRMIVEYQQGRFLGYEIRGDLFENGAGNVPIAAPATHLWKSSMWYRDLGTDRIG
ncbi:hypothetical protein VRRI112168_15540 [Vreelandella rituensis]